MLLRFVGKELDHAGFALLSFVIAEILLPCFEGHFLRQLIVSRSQEGSHLILSLTRAFPF